nr:ribosomal protein S4 [Georgeantha hexandra]
MIEWTLTMKFKTCRLLPGNVRPRELSLIQRRILLRLRNKRRSIKRNLSQRENLNSNIKSQTTRKLSLFYGNLPKSEMDRGRERTSYIPFLLNQETRSDVILVRLHFIDTLPQARQPISHRGVCLNKGLVTITHWKVSHGDLISFPENEARTRGKEIRRSFYIDIPLGKIIGKFLSVRKWRKTKTKWFRLLTTQRGCRLLLKSRFLQRMRYYMQKSDLEKTKKFGSARVCLDSSIAEHKRMLRNLFHLKYFDLWYGTKVNGRIRHQKTLYKKFTYRSGKPFFTRKKKKRIKRIELPTHYSEVNHRTPKAVVYYGPNISYIPHDIRLKDPNLPLQS